MSFLRNEKIYQLDGLKRESNWSLSSLTDHRSDESSTGYSFMSCSPAELMSASPVLQSFLFILAAVKPSAANLYCPRFSLSQPRGPLQGIEGTGIEGTDGVITISVRDIDSRLPRLSFQFQILEHISVER